MYDQPGVRVPVTFPGGGAENKDPIAHGAAAVLEGKVGFLAKTAQIGRYVDPTASEATEIQPEEDCELFLGGVHPLELAGALEAAKVGDKLFIDPETNTVVTEAKAIEMAAEEPAEPTHPLGVIDRIDTAPATDVAYVNTNALHTFIVAPAA